MGSGFGAGSTKVAFLKQVLEGALEVIVGDEYILRGVGGVV